MNLPSLSSPFPPLHLPILIFLLLLHQHVLEVAGHARLMDPPSRASMWRLGYDNPADFNDHQVLQRALGSAPSLPRNHIFSSLPPTRNRVEGGGGLI